MEGSLTATSLSRFASLLVLGVSSLTSVVSAGSSSSLMISRRATIEVINESFSTNCTFAGEIVVSHPQSIAKDDRFYVTGSLSLEAVNLVVDRVNEPERCGVSVGGQNYSLTVNTYGDNSDKPQHVAIGEYITSADANTNFLIGGYSSGLTSLLSPIAQENGQLLVAGGSTQTRVFEGRDYAYGILPPSSTYLENAFALVNEYGAKTVASLTESGVGSCVSVPRLSEFYEMDLLASTEVPTDPELDDFLALAHNMSEIDPDVMVTCVYDVGCAKWIEAMRTVNWNPKAQIFTVCIGTTELEATAGATDTAYMMGATSWVKNLPPVPDGATGWTPEEFSENFEFYTFRNVSYQTAGAATSVSVLVQAIEMADSLEPDRVRDVVANGTFPTMYGETSFDVNGQNRAPSLVLQYDPAGSLNVIGPSNSVSGDIQVVYPMPSWNGRDCLLKSACGETGGSCTGDGECVCDGEGSTSFGFAATASCKAIPIEDMSLISDTLIAIGLSMFAVQVVASLAYMAWTYQYREHPIVKASQPFFLNIIAISGIILSSSIVPLSLQNGEYRYERDPVTGLPTDEISDEVQRLDRVCMAFPWVLGLGFAIMVSALFAKIYRIKKLMESAENMRRKRVMIQDVAYIMIIFVAVQAGLLLIWQVMDPLRWQRTVTSEDPDGFPLQSVGTCSSENAMAYVIPIFSFDIAALVYAVWLCYVMRKIPDEFSEGKFVTVSVAGILQILCLAVPILIIASEERNADYFVRAGVAFGIGATVTTLIFVPKMISVWCWQDQISSSTMALSMRSRMQNSRAGERSNDCIISGLESNRPAAPSVGGITNERNGSSKSVDVATGQIVSRTSLASQDPEESSDDSGAIIEYEQDTK